MSASARKGLALPAALAVVTTLGLASWQASRALEKSALRDARAERLAAAPIAGASFAADTPDFTRLALTGRYDGERAFLVAARPGGGAQVVAPFVADGGVFLVNRGWASADGAASANSLAPPTGRVAIVGVVWPRTGQSRNPAPWPQGWPKRVRALQPARMAAAVAAMGEQEVHDVEIRLQAGSPGALRAASLAWDYSPFTHWSYVAQWLLLGAAVGVGYVLIGRRERRRG